MGMNNSIVRHDVSDIAQLIAAVQALNVQVKDLAQRSEEIDVKLVSIEAKGGIIEANIAEHYRRR
jgi:hypothetical protein